ncbi:MAG: rod shape-determining protein MreC [Novosphingobium sp.]|nr:rod shape-determining protein MreC [Novosphingobium sp.]
MAPPPNRRSGYSRKAQYTTFFGYLAAGLGALAGGGLLIASLMDPTRFSGVRSTATDATAPVAKAAAASRAEGRGVIDGISGYFAAGRQNAELRQEMERARVKLVEAQAVAEENHRLKALLGLANEVPRPAAVAMLIGSTSSSTRRYATISAGSRQGVTVGMPVRSPLGLVGRVLEVGTASARVLLITDTESVVPVRRASDGIPAFAVGRADGTLQLRLINLGINPLKRGDVVVTSGSGGLYRPGTAVAVVDSLLSDGAIARVLSDPSASEYVTVDQIWNPAVAPPLAAPATAPPKPKPKSKPKPKTAKRTPAKGAAGQ